MVKKHPWDEYVRLAVEMKAANSKLAKAQFYSAIGFKTPSQQKQADHAVGGKITLEWRRLADGALNAVQRKAQAKLAETMRELIELGQQHLALAKPGLVSPGEKDGKAIPAPMAPKGAEDFHRLFQGGAKLITSATTILTGNKPIVEATEGDDQDIEFHPAVERERKKPKAK